MTGSYDPQLNLTYWGVGNVGPDYNGAQRPGDNLYTDSVVALDADTGKLKWHYQFTPHDVYDYDSVQVPVLVDNWAGSRHQRRSPGPIATATSTCSIGRPGRFLLGKPFVKVNWMSEFDERGRPKQTPQPHGQPTYPGNQGGTNWYSPSFSPRTGLFYVSAWEDYASIYSADATSADTRKARTSSAAATELFGRCRARRVSLRRADQHLDRGGRSRRGDRARSRHGTSRSGSSR